MVKTKYLGTKFAFIILVTVVGSRLWSFHGIPERGFDVLEFLIALSLILVVIFGLHNIEGNASKFRINVWLFIIIPLIGAVSASIYHDQSIVYGLAVLRTNFIWLLYFVLHIFNIPRKYVIAWMTVAGIVWASLTILQQFTYPVYFFYTRNEEIGSEFIRAGMYRFMIEPHQFGLFLVVYYYCRFLLKLEAKALFLVLIGLAGFYCFSTRQFAVAALACMLIATAMTPGLAKVYVIGIVSVIIGILALANIDAILGTYVDMTYEQLRSSQEDIRMYSAKYWLFDYWPHWITMLVGNGLEHMNTKYGAEIFYLNDALNFYRSDVGIIGAFNVFGIFYALNIIWLNVKGILGKFYTEKTKYLKLFFVNALLLVILSEQYSNGAAIPFFCFVLYLVDKSSEKKSRIEESSKHLQAETSA